MFSKILIANRGEIACRIIRTARAMGIRTVAVYSDADANAQHVRQADEAWPIGGSRPQDSYLRGDAIIDAAKRSGAQAVHPGYGFLSENADFADAVQSAGLVFIGPSAASMRKMGSKAGAKELMQAAGVPVVPGYTGEDQSPELLKQEAARIGFPLMIKAAHGGGGKGMRIVRGVDEFLPNLESCQREARNAFGRDRVLLERYIESPRHIEIQVFADQAGNTIHLNERECSAQRRYQKVLEESPSVFLSHAMRSAMGNAALAAARAIDYANAGTVEFIVAPDGSFFFMEINTRLQVEHPVTEFVTGLDLVEWQLRVAAGEPLPMTQTDITQSGHAIEVRLYAEDPEAGFLPGSGALLQLKLPQPSAHVRIDSGVVEGDVVTIFYDPMIAKLIVWDRDRPHALARLRQALSECAIEGPKSNIAFLEKLVRHPAVIDGTIDTSYLDHHLEELLPTQQDDSQFLIAATVVKLLTQESKSHDTAVASSDPYSPWAFADGWRAGDDDNRLVAFLAHGQRFQTVAQGHAGNYRIAWDDDTTQVESATLRDGILSVRFDGTARRFRVRTSATYIEIHDGNRRIKLESMETSRRENDQATQTSNRVTAPMPGRVVIVKARPGDVVTAGQELMVIEAMKMELALKAPRDGVLAEVLAKAGDFVENDAVLMTFETALI